MNDMNEMENIFKKASELGHLLQQNEIVTRYKELAAKLEKNEDSRKLMDELLKASDEFQRKEEAGTAIEVEEKKRLKELQDKSKEDPVISEFLATQMYYINLLTQVNEAIANPKGDPPKKSDIILPGEDKSIII